MKENNGMFDRLKYLEESIENAFVRSGRNRKDIILVAAIKYANLDQINELVSLGVKNLGENRAQRIQEIHGGISADVIWHFIGHLQKNKAKIAVQKCDLIQSVDSLELASIINIHAEANNKIQSVLVQLKISEEETKFGLDERNFEEQIVKINDLKNIKIDGLMAMGPLANEQTVRRSFYKAALFYKKLEGILGCKPKILSMGMSNDYEIAIEEGSNMVRIGSFLFGG